MEFRKFKGQIVTSWQKFQTCELTKILFLARGFKNSGFSRIFEGKKVRYGRELYNLLKEHKTQKT